MAWTRRSSVTSRRLGWNRARRGRTRGLVVLSAGWSGDRVLVRLLAAEGAMRVVGYALDRPVPDPSGHLRRALDRGDGRLTGVLVMPHHLWLTNGLDADGFVADLLMDGIAVVSLARSDSVDRGVSRCLCGPVSEVLPSEARKLDAGDTAIYAQESDFASQWFETVVPDPANRIVFEDDLATVPGRQALVARLADLLHLSPWQAPPDRELPDHNALWEMVANADELRQHVDQIRALFDG